MRKIILLLFIIVYSLYSKGVYTIEGYVKNAPNLTKIYLYEYYYGKYNLIDTADFNNGKVVFNLYPENPAGIYKIQLTPFVAIEDILFNYENISFECDYKDINSSLTFKESNENKILNFYKKFTNNELNREKAFLYLLGFYSSEDEFYDVLNKEMQRIRTKNKKLINTIIEENEKMLVSRYLRYDQLPNIELSGVFTKDRPKIIDKYWDNIDFSDTLLLYLPIFDKKIDNYLILVENDSVNSTTQEQMFIEAISKLLQKAEVNKRIYKYIAQKLLQDSKDFQLYNLYKFLANKLIEKNLVSKIEKDEIEKEFFKIKQLQVGNLVPDFNITSELKLYDIQSEFTLLVFWEADCDLCLDKLKDLKILYDHINNHDKFEVVGINLNRDNIIYQKAILENDFKWINLSDFKGWNSDLVKTFNISRTPTMILLDKNKRIISRPVKVEEIERLIKKG